MSENIRKNLDSLTSEMLKPLTVIQLKKVRALVDEAVQQNDLDLQQTEKERNGALREIGNHLHESVPVSNDEVHDPWVLTFGAVAVPSSPSDFHTWAGTNYVL